MRDYSSLDGVVVGMDAVTAAEKVGPNYMDADNFYPADGDDPQAVDISYDEEDNDLSGSSSDYFDGDASSYFDGDGYSSYDGDDFFSVDGDGKKRRQEKRDERKEKRKDVADERKGKREDRADERKERQDERRELRSQKKKAKIDEIEARNKLTESLSQPDQTADLLKSMQDPMETKSATEKKGMSTTTIILIATGGLVVLGLTAFLLLRRKK